MITEQVGRKRKLHLVAAIFLLLNGVPALIAGTMLMLDPSGRKLLLDESLLVTSPFRDFFIPGIILFVVNGLFSLFALVSLLKRSKYYAVFIIVQGVILTGWITFQIMLISDPSWLQLIYGFVGLMLIVTGLKLENLNNGRGAYQEI